MPVIGAAYGYGGAPELRTAGADRIIDHARDLPATVAELIQT
jgi:phosphoglycolate phosphatase-like HAD superfamily hydrolase